MIVRTRESLQPSGLGHILDPSNVVRAAKESGADAIIITKSGIHKYRVSDGMGGSVPYNSKFMEIEAIVYTDK